VILSEFLLLDLCALGMLSAISGESHPPASNRTLDLPAELRVLRLFPLRQEMSKSWRARRDCVWHSEIVNECANIPQP
jgi:hypothetical protein